MRANEEPRREEHDEGRHAEYSRRDDFRETYVPLGETVVKQVQRLHDEQSDVGVVRCEHGRAGLAFS